MTVRTKPMRELPWIEQNKKLGRNMKRLIAKQYILLPKLIQPSFLKLRTIEILIIRMKSIPLSRMGY